MENINTLLFDFDGTLLDSKKSMINVYHTLCRNYGTKIFSKREIENQFGSSFHDIIDSLDKTKKSEIEQQYFELMTMEEEKHARLFPLVKESLISLKLMGYKTALVTNKERPIVELSLNRFRLTNLFNTVVTVSDVTNPKPHPEPLEKALAEIDGQKNKAMMLGDTIFDVGASRNAGIKSAVIDWYNKYPLKELEPDYIFHNLGEFMLKIFEHREVV